MNNHEFATDILGHQTFRAVGVDQVDRGDFAVAREAERGFLAVVEKGFRLEVDEPCAENRQLRAP